MKYIFSIFVLLLSFESIAKNNLECQGVARIGASAFFAKWSLIHKNPNSGVIKVNYSTKNRKAHLRITTDNFGNIMGGGRWKSERSTRNKAVRINYKISENNFILQSVVNQSDYFRLHGKC